MMGLLRQFPATSSASASLPQYRKFLSGTHSTLFVDDVTMSGKNRDVNDGKQHIFTLNTAGTSLAVFLDDNQCYANTVYYGGASTITSNSYSVDASNRWVDMLQYQTNKAKFIAIDDAGELQEIDYSAVLTAGGNPTKTTLISDIEDATEAGATLAWGTTCIKWLGTDDTVFALFYYNAGTVRVSTYKNTSGTWARVSSAEQAGLSSFTAASCVCSRDVTSRTGEHYAIWCNSAGNTGMVAVKASFNASYVVTLDRFYSSTALTLDTVRNFGAGQLAWIGGSANYTTYPMTDSGSALSYGSTNNNTVLGGDQLKMNPSNWEYPYNGTGLATRQGSTSSRLQLIMSMFGWFLKLDDVGVRPSASYDGSGTHISGESGEYLWMFCELSATTSISLLKVTP